MTITPESVLEEVNARHRSDWRLAGRLRGGHQSGAFLVDDAAGRRAVLKWSAAPEWAGTVLAAEPVVAAARAEGWPTPAWLAVGQTSDGHPYQVQEFVAGETQEAITHDWLDLVLPAVALQAGLGRDGMRDWWRYDTEVAVGAPGAHRLAVAGTGPAGAVFESAVREVAGRHGAVTLPADDLVHGDLNPGNAILAGGRLPALVDVEALGRGTRLHDLATLLLYATLWGHDPTVRTRLTLVCQGLAEQGGLEICLAAVAVGLLEFGVRHWPPADLVAACHDAAGLLRNVAR